MGAYFLDVQKHFTLDLLAPWPRARLLEVGGGHGQLTAALVDAGYEVTVHGSSPACVDRIDALVRAGKEFDFVLIPGANHGAGSRITQRKLQDFFVRHLLQREPENHNLD